MYKSVTKIQKYKKRLKHNENVLKLICFVNDILKVSRKNQIILVMI
jgi:hypothetical protein